MLDAVSKQPIRVHDYNRELPFMIVPYAQLGEVRSVLDKHQFRYEVSEETLTVNDGPEEVFIRLARGTDPKQVQSALDRA